MKTDPARAIAAVSSGIPHPERRALAKRAARPVPDGVAVLPVPRRIAGVEPGRAGRRSWIATSGGRSASSARPSSVVGEPPVVGECDHLSAGVHAGIRPAGPVDPLRRPVAEAGQRGLQDPLDRPFPRIDLEPGEVRSVVFDPRAIALAGRPLGRRVDKLMSDRVRSGRSPRRRRGAGRGGRSG